MQKRGHTADQILDVAQALVQSHGYNGFSYADVAQALRIRKPSIHHHFPAKADLGRALMARYRQRFGAALAEISASNARAAGKLQKYASLFRSVLQQDNRMCMCGMLAADFSTLPRPLRDSVRDFFGDNEDWLEGVLRLGRADRALAFDGPPRAMAVRILAAFEGAMLVARSFEDTSRFDTVARAVLGELKAT
ncbi:MAG: TetR/AcrR family transcriptional regulator [Planctomycetes bacterium]|nr:TetR/AcrR family transcriptional regulator [Planctomycetota bacterium]